MGLRVCDLQSHLLRSFAFTKLLVNLRDFTGIDSGMGELLQLLAAGSGDFQALSQMCLGREFSFNDLAQCSDCSAGQLDLYKRPWGNSQMPITGWQGCSKPGLKCLYSKHLAALNPLWFWVWITHRYSFLQQKPTIYVIYSFYLPAAFLFSFFPSLQHVPRSSLQAFVLGWNVWRLLWGVPVITCIPVHGLLGRLLKLWIKKHRNWQPCELPVKNHTWVYEAVMSSRTFGSNSWGDSVTGGKKRLFQHQYLL